MLLRLLSAFPFSLSLSTNLTSNFKAIKDFTLRYQHGKLQDSIKTAIHQDYKSHHYSQLPRVREPPPQTTTMAPPMYDYFSLLENSLAARHEQELPNGTAGRRGAETLIPDLPATDEFASPPTTSSECDSTAPTIVASASASRASSTTAYTSDRSSSNTSTDRNLSVYTLPRCFHPTASQPQTCITCAYWRERLYYPSSLGEGEDEEDKNAGIDLQRYPGGREDSLLHVKGVRRLSAKERKRVLEFQEGREPRERWWRRILGRMSKLRSGERMG